MDVFLESAQRAVTAHGACGVDFAALHNALASAPSADAVKELVYGLVDAYGSQEDSGTYRQAIMEAIGHALHRIRTAHKGDGLTVEDLLMLAMFFNELATTTDPTLFCTFARTVAGLYALAVPAAYAGAAAGSEEEEQAKASVRGELVALRQVMAKRLSTPASATSPSPSASAAYSRTTAVARSALDCLVGMVRAQMAALRTHERSATALAEEVKETVEGLMGPLATLLDEQQQQQQQQQGGAAQPPLGRGHGGSPIPASLLTSVLGQLEAVLWAAERQCDVVSCPTGVPAVAAAVFRHTVSTLLSHLQRYLTLQQHRQMANAAGALGDGAGALGSASAASPATSAAATATDVLRLYGVQHAVQRVLSVATTCASAVRHGKGGERPEAEVVRLLTATLSNGLQAALSAFGGAVTVHAPQATHTEEREEQQPQPEEEVGAWAVREGSRVRRSGNALAATVGAGGVDANDLLFAVAGEGTLPEGGEEAYLDEDDGLLLGTTREPLLKSSAGLVTAAMLADMVLQSVGALDRGMVNTENLRGVHLQGLAEMQHAAARRAQREELENQRAIERQGVEAIPATKLLNRVRDSANIQAKGMATLRRLSARAVLEKAAFSSVLRGYAFVQEESEATVRAAQALIGRCLVQLPSTMADAALDELFMQLQYEFRRERRLREANPGRAPAHSVVDKMHSYYQLTLQVLFTFAAAQAPIHERGELSPLLLYPDSNMGGANVGAAHVMTSHANVSVDTENPIAFLQDESTRTPSYQTSAAMTATRDRTSASRKRRRRENNAAAAASDEDGGDGEGDPDRDDDAAGGAGDDEDDDDFAFFNDTARAASPYSHVLCRVMELAESCKVEVILRDVLRQAPMLPRYVWSHIYRRFCLSTVNQARCNMGFLLLTDLATRRPVYRSCAVNLLLQLCMSRNDYARRVAIISVGHLLAIPSGDGRPVVPPEVEAALVHYAKKQLAAIPGYQFTTVLRATREAGGTAVLDAATIAALQADEDKKAQEVLGRHLGLFLKLCARQPRSLFATLLDVYQQCVQRNNEVMVRLLPANKDVQAMTGVLLEADPATFMTTVVPFLRRYSAEASLFVQSLLWTISAKLRTLCSQANSKAAAAAAEGGLPGSGGGAERGPEYFKSVAAVMLEHARAMYDMSRIPLGASGAHSGSHDAGHHHHTDEAAYDEDEASQGGFILHDARFLAPFFSLIPTAEVREKYLPAFLYFVQVQLQFQRFYRELQQQQQAQGDQAPVVSGSLTITLLSAKERSYVLTHEELKQFIALVVREVLVKAPFKFNDGATRGLSPVEFFVYLHRSPQESLKAAGGQLSPSGTEAAAAAGTPPIGTVTTKEVLSVCLELTRTFTFDALTSGTPKLYGVDEVQRAIKKMMHPPPVPSQLMATVLLAVPALYPRGSRHAVVREFLHFVVGNVLTPLERASAWETDPQLWKGVLLFVEKFYVDCSGFMVNLPDQVLLQALREQPRLAEKFREEHGNNASFGHILGNI